MVAAILLKRVSYNISDMCHMTQWSLKQGLCQFRLRLNTAGLLVQMMKYWMALQRPLKRLVRFILQNYC